jgi:nitroreductase
VQRRSFLKGAGIVTVAVVGGGVWRAWDQGVFSVGEGPAYEPWKDWRKTGNDAPVALFTAEADRKKIAEISSVANAEIYSDTDVQHGSERWIRTKWNSVQQYRDGLTIDAFGLPPIATAIAKMMSVRMLRWASSRSTENGYSKLMLGAPLIGFIAVRDRYAQEQCLQAGRIWQRAHLFATARGLAARPCNEAVEMVDHERALGLPASRAALLNEITADPTWQPTFVFYMGYPKLSAHASPRRPVEAVLV